MSDQPPITRQSVDGFIYPRGWWARQFGAETLYVPVPGMVLETHQQSKHQSVYVPLESGAESIGKVARFMNELDIADRATQIDPDETEISQYAELAFQAVAHRAFNRLSIDDQIFLSARPGENPFSGNFFEHLEARKACKQNRPPVWATLEKDLLDPASVNTNKCRLTSPRHIAVAFKLAASLLKQTDWEVESETGGLVEIYLDMGGIKETLGKTPAGQYVQVRNDRLVVHRVP